MKHFDLGQYRDEYEEKLRGLIESKSACKEIVVSPVEEPRAVINLMDALRKSLAQVKEPRVRAISARKSPSRRKDAPSHRQRSAARRKMKPQ